MTDVTPPHYAGIDEIAARLRAGSTTSVELTRHLLERIAVLDRDLHAYRTVSPERALDDAARADAELAVGLDRGLLHGVPVAVKDVMDIAPPSERPAGSGDAGAAGSSVVARLTTAGAVLLGTLTSTEGSWLAKEPYAVVPVNPWRADQACGVTVNGAGSAVAAGLCFAAVTTETGGSARCSAASTGVTGLKPTRGRVSGRGLFLLADSLDQVGPMCRSVQDAATVLGVIGGRDELDPMTLTAAVPDYTAAFDPDLSGLRIGVDATWSDDAVDPEVSATVASAAEVLAGLGAQVEPVHMPSAADVTASWASLTAVEATLQHAGADTQATEYGVLSGMFEVGRRTLGTDVVLAQRVQAAFVQDLRALFELVDVVLVPTRPNAELTVAQLERAVANSFGAVSLMRFGAPFNLSGNPALCLPGGATASGLPLSFQLVARPLAESLLFRVAFGYQSVTDWHMRHPAL